ncbi:MULTISPECIES: HAD family hydrolase [Enterococcus]|uniref:HAD family hydrolase n=1 Tax=Enterococcus TaxID=1350 RepID=UPI000EBDEA40|nr:MULTISPECIES: HAD family hydrolase [Enterococcus]HCM84708.1 HAD family hydrolase [Enterococcus sp.]
MNDVKIIFFDVDGTLIDMTKKQISEKMLATLKALKEQNIILCIATGRSPIALPQFDDIAFDAFLTFNGSYCFNHTESIHKNPIRQKDVDQIVANSTSLNRPVAIATSNKTITNGKDEDLVEYFSFAHQEVIVSEDFDATIMNEDIFQIMLGSRKEEYAKVMQDTTSSKITAWWDRAVDIIPTSSGKGTGIKKMLDYYGFDKSQALAFGDGNNDIEMLEAVGWGLAMANASDELKETADEIIGHVADDGIYHYCIEKGLIGAI